jgi:hypothetical protein
MPMLSGPKAPHTPTLECSVVILIAALIAYHLLLGRK